MELLRGEHMLDRTTTSINTNVPLVNVTEKDKVNGNFIENYSKPIASLLFSIVLLILYNTYVCLFKCYKNNGECKVRMIIFRYANK